MSTLSHPIRRNWTNLVAASALLAIGCARDPSPLEPRAPRVDQPRLDEAPQSAEMDAEQQDFIAKTEEQLDELDQRIRDLEMHAYDSIAGVTEAERNQWKEELEKLRFRTARVSDRLEHVWAASPDEWRALRESIVGDLRRLTNDVASVATQVTVVEDPLAPDGDRQPTGGLESSGMETGPTY